MRKEIYWTFLKATFVFAMLTWFTAKLYNGIPQSNSCHSIQSNSWLAQNKHVKCHWQAHYLHLTHSFNNLSGNGTYLGQSICSICECINSPFGLWTIYSFYISLVYKILFVQNKLIIIAPSLFKTRFWWQFIKLWYPTEVTHIRGSGR